MGNIIEIAGGKIKESTSLEIKNNAGETIKNNTLQKLIQSGTETGVSYKTPPKDERKIENSIKGIAIFRRLADYRNKPDYGFDWYAGENNGTTYTEPFNYNNLVLDGKDKLKKEYSPFFKYIKSKKFHYTNAGTNSGKSGLKIIEQEYYVPWFSGFAKDESGTAKSYELDVFFNILEPDDGQIGLDCEDPNIDAVFSDTGDTRFDLTKGSVKQFSKKIKITFLDYITEHTCITILFYKKSEEQKAEEKKWEEDAKSGKVTNQIQTVYVIPGELMGVINVYKNSIEYNLKARYVKTYFYGWVKVKGYDDLIYVLKRGELENEYKEHANIVGKKKDLNKKLVNLQTELTNVTEGKGGWFSRSSSTIEDKIKVVQKEISDLEQLTIKRLQVSKELFSYQSKTLEQNMKGLFTKYYDKILWTFGQALIRFDLEKDDIMDVDMEDFVSDNDGKYLEKIPSYWKLMETGLFSNEGSTGDYKNPLEEKYRDLSSNNENVNLLFLLPFHIDELGGEAESVFASADSMIIGPSVINSNDWCTVPHEISHTLGLMHSFPDMGNNKLGGFITDILHSGHLFKKAETENVMDYKYGDRIYTYWKWQWEKMHDKDTEDLQAIDKNEEKKDEKN